MTLASQWPSSISRWVTWPECRAHHRDDPIARDSYGADVVMFPELALSGYPPEDLLYRPSFLQDCEAALHAIAADVQGIVAVVGWPQAAGAVVYNAASVLRDGGDRGDLSQARVAQLRGVR